MVARGRLWFLFLVAWAILPAASPAVAFFSNYQTADLVLGQLYFTSNTARSNEWGMTSVPAGFVWSRGVVSDGNRLATVDVGNSRVMIWNSLPTQNGQAADFVLGQSSGTGSMCNQGNASPTNATMCRPQSLWWDGYQFFVSDTGNNRILVWNGWPTYMNQPADYVIGQPNFNQNTVNNNNGDPNINGRQYGLAAPIGLYSDANTLWVADWANHRVVAYDKLPITANYPAAVLVLGQPDFGTNGLNQNGLSASSMYNPSGVFYDGERLYVADLNNNRVLRWNSRPTTNGQMADLVLGQPDFSTNTANNSGLKVSSESLNGKMLSWPAMVYSDGARLYVSDVSNRRLLIWKSIPTQNGQAADVVLGQANFGSVSCCVPSANLMSSPDGSFLTGEHLWQQDNFHNRVLRFTSTGPYFFDVSIASALAPSSIAQGSPAVGLRLNVRAPVNSLTWNRLTVYNDGPLAAESLQARLFKESNGNDIFDSSDTAVSNPVTLSGNKADLNLTSQSLGPDYATYYLVVYVNAENLPYSGINGFPKGGLRVYHSLTSFGFDQSDVEFSGQVPVGVAYNTGRFTPVDEPDAVVFGGESKAPTQVVSGAQGVVMATLRLSTQNDFAFLRQLKVAKVGTAADTDIAGLTLWRDNGNGSLDSGDVRLTATTSPFTGGFSNLIPTSPLSISRTEAQYLIVADVKNTDIVDETFGVAIDTASFTLAGVDYVDVAGSTTPFVSSSTLIRTPNTLTVQGESALPAEVFLGQEVAALKLILSVNKGKAQVHGFVVNRTGTRTDADISEVLVYRDTENNGIFDSKLDQWIGEGTLSSASADIEVSTQTLSAGTTQGYFVTYRIGPSASEGHTVGAAILAGGVKVLGVLTSVAGPFPIKSTEATIKATVNTLLAEGSDLALRSPVQGERDMAFLKLELWADANALFLNQIRVSRIGTASDADVDDVRVWRSDTESFNAATSTPIGSGAFSNGPAAIALNPQQKITPSTQTYFITLSIADLAQPGRTLGVELSSSPEAFAFVVSEPNVVSTTSFPLQSSTVSVVQFGNLVSISTASLAPTIADPGQTNVPMMRLGLKTDVSQAIWSGMIVERLGTTSDADVKAVKVYSDADASGAPSSADTLISSVSFSAGKAVLKLTPQILSTTEKFYFVTVDIAPDAQPLKTLALWMNQDSISVNQPNTVSAVTASGATLFPIRSGELTIRKPPVSVLVSAQSLAPASVTQGDLNVPVLKLHLAANKYSTQWTRLTLSRTGDGPDTNISNLKLFRDTNGNGALDLSTDTLVSLGTSNVFSGGTAVLQLTTQTITTNQATYFLLVDISPTAKAATSNGVGILVPSALGFTPPDGAASNNFPIYSSTFTILPTQTGLFVSAQNVARPTLQQGATAQPMLALTLQTTTQYSVVLSAVRVERQGTAYDDDLQQIRVFLDADGNGSFDNDDHEITAGPRRFVQGSALVDFTPQTIGITPRTLFLALDVSDVAEVDRTVGVLIAKTTSFFLNAPNFVVDQAPPIFPIKTEPLVSISKKPRTVYFAGQNTASAGTFQGAENAPFLKLAVSVSGYRALWSSLRVDKVGSLADSRVRAAKLYKDANGNGALEPASDVLVASGTFSNGSIQFGLAQDVWPSSAAYLVALDLDLKAEPDQTVGLVISGADFVGVDSPDTVAAFGPVQSLVSTVRDVRTPVTPSVSAAGGRYSRSLTQLPFSWQSRMVTSQGEVTAAQYAIGTSPGGTEAKEWTDIGPTQTQVTPFGLELSNGATYYITVRALSSFGFWSDLGFSEPILVDAVTPQLSGQVAASLDANAVVVRWPPAQAGPSGIRGYLLEYRRGDSPRWNNARTRAPSSVQVASLGTSDQIPTAELLSANTVVLTDLPPGTYLFRVSAVNGAGALATVPIFSERVVLGPLPPDLISSAASYPNPFDSRKQKATLHYILKEDVGVTIEIFDVYGRKVKRMEFAPGSSGGQMGSNEVNWDGTASGGGKVSKGVYLAVIRAGGSKKIVKIAVIH